MPYANLNAIFNGVKLTDILVLSKSRSKDDYGEILLIPDTAKMYRGIAHDSEPQNLDMDSAGGSVGVEYKTVILRHKVIIKIEDVLYFDSGNNLSVFRNTGLVIEPLQPDYYIQFIISGASFIYNLTGQNITITVPPSTTITTFLSDFNTNASAAIKAIIKPYSILTGNEFVPAIAQTFMSWLGYALRKPAYRNQWIYTTCDCMRLTRVKLNA